MVDKSLKEKVVEFLNEENYFTNSLAFVEKKTGIPRLFLFGGKHLHVILCAVYL